MKPVQTQESTPLVSIVVTNYNYARFLRRGIESALTQTWPRTEVVVVDDASEDESAEIIRRYGKAVTPVLQSQNRGQGAAMNAGFRNTRGDLVIFLDADDYLFPHAVASIVAVWSAEVAIVQYRLNLVDPEGRVIDVFPAPEVRFDTGDVVPILLARGRFEASVTSGNAFSRSALESILPVPESEFRVSADGYLVTIAPFAGPVVSIEKPLGAYCQHGGNIWAGKSASGKKYRKLLEHDARRYQALREKAHERGLAIAPQPGLRDHRHLESRMASLCLEPEQHPSVSDSRLSLALRGLWACRTARLPRGRRMLLGAWFVLSGLLPRTLAQTWVAWYLDKTSRPQLVQRLARTIRRLTSHGTPALAVARVPDDRSTRT
jgi:hypothetical protein